MSKDDKYYSKGLENFGDLLTPYIVEKLSGLKPIYFEPTTLGAKFITHSMMTGSIIDEVKPNTIVWGSGISFKRKMIEGGDFRAVRGPETVNKLKELGYNVPLIIGDPSILLPLLYKPSTKKIYKLGIIPHYVDYAEIKLSFCDVEGVRVINLMTDNVENVIDEIYSCEKVVSTSLHGLIVANVYNIPSLWLKYSDRLIGDDVKFYDYFQSVKLDNVSFVSKDEFDYNNIEKYCFSIPSCEVIFELQKGLLTSYPYKLKI